MYLASCLDWCALRDHIAYRFRSITIQCSHGIQPHYATDNVSGIMLLTGVRCGMILPSRLDQSRYSAITGYRPTSISNESKARRRARAVEWPSLKGEQEHKGAQNQVVDIERSHQDCSHEQACLTINIMCFCFFPGTARLPGLFKSKLWPRRSRPLEYYMRVRFCHRPCSQIFCAFLRFVPRCPQHRSSYQG